MSGDVQPADSQLLAAVRQVIRQEIPLEPAMRQFGNILSRSEQATARVEKAVAELVPRIAVLEERTAAHAAAISDIRETSVTVDLCASRHARINSDRTGDLADRRARWPLVLGGIILVANLVLGIIGLVR
jgi:hypothetical protein